MKFEALVLENQPATLSFIKIPDASTNHSDSEISLLKDTVKGNHEQDTVFSDTSGANTTYKTDYEALVEQFNNNFDKYFPTFGVQAKDK
jgi:hypothetical protein